MVLGCGGEIFAEHRKFRKTLADMFMPHRSLQNRLKQWCGWAVVIALGVEVIAFSCGFLASNAQIQALTAANLGLQTQVLKLKMATEPRAAKFRIYRQYEIEMLTPFAGTPVHVENRSDDSESDELGDALHDILSDCGWTDAGRTSGIYTGKQPRNVSIESNITNLVAAFTIGHLLYECGITNEVRRSDSADCVRIVVGSK
jgi:hypothetical protein